MMDSAALDAVLDEPYALTAEQIERFERFGYAKLSGVLPAETLARYREPIRETTMANDPKADIPLEEKDTYGKAFIQVCNLWRMNEAVKRFVMSRRLGRIAAELLGVSGVRLYHDQALFKEATGGITPWHVDQFYWPLATDRTVTAWIPLVEVPIEMGPLSFAAGSHKLGLGRDLGISDDSERELRESIEAAACPLEASAYALGDVSFHLGWTAHRAGPNQGDRAREVMTVIYMDEAMRLKSPEHDFQKADREAFCPGVGVGEVVASEMNPVVYSRG
ncbi:phytanoyl-CoA dioxygenase family protein [Mucisphaera sp.]|uniref:phytanoyl-CoA dioxygenase family protein n=1 Tax=Mucisphaera sp. TaxID=2913024 RepID=UPI003D129073